MAIRGQSRWPSAGNSVAIYGQFFMAANNLARIIATERPLAAAKEPSITAKADAYSKRVIAATPSLVLRRHYRHESARSEKEFSVLDQDLDKRSAPSEVLAKSSTIQAEDFPRTPPAGEGLPTWLSNYLFHAGTRCQ